MGGQSPAELLGFLGQFVLQIMETQPKIMMGFGVFQCAKPGTRGQSPSELKTLLEAPSGHS